MARTSAVAALRDRLAEVTAERDRLAAYLDLCVWVDPARMGGKPCVGGTRIPVDMITAYVADGMYDELRAGWEEITERQILVACWHAGIYGDRPEWWDWAMDAERLLWQHDGELPSLPPIAATQSTASAEDRAATTGAGSAPSRAQGPHDATGSAPGPTAEGTLPAPKDTTKETP